MKILLSAGHGASDPGSIGNGYREADLTRQITLSQEKALKAAGHTVEVRDFSKNEFDQALNLSYQYYDLVISNHINSYGNPDANGVETWYSSSYPVNSKSIADKVQSALVSSTGLRNRGVKQEDWRIIYLAGKQLTNAILIEHGFISNANDMKVILANVDKTSAAIAQALGGGTVAPSPEPAPSPSSEKIEKRWAETGAVVFNKTAPVYAEPNDSGKVLVSYNKGEKLNRYDECVKTNKHLYLKYTRSAGGHGYVVFRDVNPDGSYGPAYGSIIDEAVAPAPVKEKILKRWNETGRVLFSASAQVHSEPDANSKVLATYNKGETLNRYDECIKTDKHLYLKYTRSAGGYGYLRLRSYDPKTNKYGPSAGTIK